MQNIFFALGRQTPECPCASHYKLLLAVSVHDLTGQGSV
uniref:Uncharacterized protein n=1 Tax=Anguilla anguilla TaxID=7936 RepID=A0A0E9TTH9_ANGAN